MTRALLAVLIAVPFATQGVDPLELLSPPLESGQCASFSPVDNVALSQKYGEIASYMYSTIIPGFGHRLFTVYRDSLNRDVMYSEFVQSPDSTGKRFGKSIIVVLNSGVLAGFRMQQALAEPGQPAPPLTGLTPLAAKEIARTQELAQWVYRRCSPRR